MCGTHKTMVIMSRFVRVVSFACLAMALIVSCTREIGSDEVPGGSVLSSFTAYHGDNTKTMLDDNGVLMWEAGDRVHFYTSGVSDAQVKFISSSCTSANFKVEANDYLIGVYGAEASNWSASEVTVPYAVRSCQNGIFGGGHVSIARTTDITSEKLLFYNVTSFLKFSIQSDEVMFVDIESRSNTKLCGDALIHFGTDGIPAGTFTGDAGYYAIEVFTDCAPGTYYAALLPGTYKDGFTISYYDSHSRLIGTAVLADDITLSRNKILNLGVIDNHLSKTVLESIESYSPDSGPWGPVFKYHYLTGHNLGIAGSAQGIDYEEQVGYRISVFNEAIPEDSYYNVGSLEDAGYFVKPAEYIFERDVKQWGFECFDRDGSGAISETPTRWSAKFAKIERVKGDYTRVWYTIEDVQYLTDSAIRLYAEDKANNNMVVFSDFATIEPCQESLEHFEFYPRFGAIASECDAIPSIPGNNKLFNTAAEAAENPASVDVVYNGEPLNLHYIFVHIKDHNSLVSVPSLLDMYPDLEVHYQFIEYNLGTNALPESVYGIIERNDYDDYFYPAYPRITSESNWGKVKIEGANDSASRSAIGHRPIILVTLVDHSGNVLLAGYFKIKIIDEPPVSVPPVDLLVKDFGEIGYVCSLIEKEITWYDMSSQILENGLEMSFDDFRNNYSWELNTTYYKDDGGAMVVSSQYGNITYINGDASIGNGTITGANDIFRLSVNKSQADMIGVGKTMSLYARFTKNANSALNGSPDDVYIGLTFKVSDKPVVKFIKKNPVYWYGDLTYKYPNDTNTDLGMATIRGSVRTPFFWKKGSTNNSASVTLFDMNINDKWLVNSSSGRKEPRIVNPSTGSVIPGASYFYRFSADNRTISVNGKKWVVVDDNTISWNGTNVLRLTSDGYITVECNSESKKLLNWATSIQEIVEDPSLTENYLYCNVDLVAQLAGSNSNDACEVHVEQIRVRLLRPLIMTIDTKDHYIIDGRPMGYSVPIHDFFSVRDYNNNIVFAYDETTGSLQKGYYPVGSPEADATIDWYDYYDIQSLTIYMDSVQTDIYAAGSGRFHAVNNVIPEVMIGIVDPRDPMNPHTRGKVSIDMKDLNNLSGWSLWFADTDTHGTDFNLKFTVGLNYAWGELTKDLIIPVRSN